MNLSVADVLERAADLIDEPGRWTRGHIARNSAGEGVPADHPAAVCWCAVGALERVSGEQGGKPFHALLRVVGDFPDEATFGEKWNDAPGRTQSEVVSKLREAAALARKEGVSHA